MYKQIFYFQTNINDLKNTWKGIKKLISLKRTSNFVPSAVIENNFTLIKPEDIANAFNKCFVNISSTIQFTIKFSRNKFHRFLPRHQFFFHEVSRQNSD